jgi:hypothetical protein
MVSSVMTCIAVHALQQGGGSFLAQEAAIAVGCNLTLVLSLQP